MAVYTTELRTFFDQFSHYKGNPPLFPSHSEKIEMGREKLFNFDYPVFDESYRKVFETNFIRKFYMREIGFETFGLFQFQLETWLLINMPYWNKMLESELLQYDPLTNAEMSVSHSKKTDKTQNDVRDTLNTTTTSGVNEATSNRVGTVEKTDTSNANQTGTNETLSNSEINATSETSQENTLSGETNESGTATDDNFNRQLDSNNPDSRLSITAVDGEGVIEYASSIKENNENNSKNTSKSGTSSSTSNATGSQTSNAVDSGTTSQTSSISNDVTSQSNSDTTDIVTDHAETNVTGSGNRNDTLTSSVNDIEDFIQHRIGKIGVQSYPKMVKEYRESLLRIEKQIFDEMNELFMLVY